MDYLQIFDKFSQDKDIADLLNEITIISSTVDIFQLVELKSLNVIVIISSKFS